MGEQRRRVDADLRRQVRRARPGSQHHGVELGSPTSTRNDRGALWRDIQRVHPLPDDRVTSLGGQVCPYRVDFDDPATDVEQRRRRHLDGGNPQPVGASADQLVVRARRGHSRSAIGHVSASDDASAVHQHRPTRLTTPPRESLPGRLRDPHQLRV